MNIVGEFAAVSLLIIWRKGGIETFFNQGTNGHWQGALAAELTMYEQTNAKVLTPMSSLVGFGGGEAGVGQHRQRIVDIAFSTYFFITTGKKSVLSFA